jgi:hypothetical protein
MTCNPVFTLRERVIIDAPFRFWNGREGVVIAQKANSVDGLLVAVNTEVPGGSSVVWLRECELVSMSALQIARAAGKELDS